MLRQFWPFVIMKRLNEFDLVGVQGQRVKHAWERERVPHTPFSARRPYRTHRTLASRNSGHCCHICQPLSLQNTNNSSLHMRSHTLSSSFLQLLIMVRYCLLLLGYFIAKLHSIFPRQIALYSPCRRLLVPVTIKFASIRLSI